MDDTGTSPPPPPPGGVQKDGDDDFVPYASEGVASASVMSPLHSLFTPNPPCYRRPSVVSPHTPAHARAPRAQACDACADGYIVPDCKQRNVAPALYRTSSFDLSTELFITVPAVSNATHHSTIVGYTTRDVCVLVALGGQLTLGACVCARARVLLCHRRRHQRHVDCCACATPSRGLHSGRLSSRIRGSAGGTWREGAERPIHNDGSKPNKGGAPWQASWSELDITATV